MLPRLRSDFVTTSIVVMLAASIIATLDGGWFARWASLAPARIFHGEVWRLVTWPLIQLGPLSLVLSCVAVYKFGGELAVRWGDRRLQRFSLHVVLGAGIVTCVIAAVVGATQLHHLGGWAVADALVIAWARQFPERCLVIYGVLRLRGRDIVRLVTGVALLFAIFYGPVAMAPELAACLAAAAYPRSWLRA